MNYYIKRGQFQEYLNQHYKNYKKELSFLELMNTLKKNNLLSKTKPKISNFEMADELSDENFFELLNSFPIIFHSIKNNSFLEKEVSENDVIPENRDIYVMQHFQNIKNGIHSHNCIEIHYVIKGACTFIFEKEQHIIKEGELCLIAPFSKHDNNVHDNSIVITILIRKSTFNSTFFSLLSQKNLLSHFFRTILYDNSQSNFLLFFTKNTPVTKKIIKHIAIENVKDDDYSNINCISWINLLFSNVLRNYSQTIQFYNYKMGYNFSLVLQYIQHNYHTATLTNIAEVFHYSKTYLAALIKKNTGYTFNELIKHLRMTEASKYLLNSNMKISDIAEIIGYNSTDHFSRTFKSYFKNSPQNYRKENR
jgi:AraC-like DNA-binding protein